MHLRAWSIKVADDSSHAGLITHCSGKVDRFLRVIFGKTADSQESAYGYFDVSEPLNLAAMS